MLSRVSVLTQRRSGCALRSAATCIAVRCMSSAAKVRVYASAVNDPFFNYATEDYLFRQLQPDTDVLYLWQNNKTVRRNDVHLQRRPRRLLCCAVQ